MGIDSILPNPALLYEEFQAFQRSLALRTALELDLFTHIDSGAATSEALATECRASERGIRILCDYLVVIGHLSKQSNTYGLPLNSSLYLSTRSSAYIGSAAGFLAGDEALRSFARLADTVRAGGSAYSGNEQSSADYWTGFAKSMAAFAEPVARATAASVALEVDRPLKILDVAAGHGLYGLAFAARCPNAEIYALDHPAVLEVAEKNARQAGFAERFQLIPGDVFDVDAGGPYDVIVVANLAHHFGKRVNTTLFGILHSAIKGNGQLVLVDFVPNDDRVSPAHDAAFALSMLATTAEGETYTFREYQDILRAAGFQAVHRPDVGGLPHWVIVASP